MIDLRAARFAVSKLHLPLRIATISLFAFPCLAQAGSQSALRDYDLVVSILRTDYAGFPAKTDGAKAEDFARLEREHRAAIEKNPDSAPAEIRALLQWFEDRHLGLSGPSSDTSVSGPDPAALAEEGPRLSVSEDDARAAYRNAPESTAGIWSSVDGNYRLAVVPSLETHGQLIGVVLSTRSPSWSAGQIKFHLKPTGQGIWRMADQTKEPVTAAITSNLIRLPEVGVALIREFPEPFVGRDRLVPSNEFFLRRLSPKTLWLRLPDFAAEHRAEIEALLAQHDAELRSTPNLIVDLRDNSGGADSAYAKLMGYLYTRPIYSIGAEVRNTERNQSYFSGATDRADLPPDTRTFIGNLLERLRSSDAEWVPLFPRGFSITTYPERMPFPKQVGIIGTGAGSSGEQFVIDARFSHKVTLFGGSTAGVIDYSNVSETQLPSNNDYVLRWPITRSQRLPEEPLNNVGVPPDVPFGPDIEDPVGATQAWLESHTR